MKIKCVGFLAENSSADSDLKIASYFFFPRHRVEGPSAVFTPSRSHRQAGVDSGPVEETSRDHHGGECPFRDSKRCKRSVVRREER
jgi:hypothetical protein